MESINKDINPFEAKPTITAGIPEEERVTAPPLRGHSHPGHGENRHGVPKDHGAAYAGTPV